MAIAIGIVGPWNLQSRRTGFDDTQNTATDDSVGSGLRLLGQPRFQGDRRGSGDLPLRHDRHGAPSGGKDSRTGAGICSEAVGYGIR